MVIAARWFFVFGQAQPKLNSDLPDFVAESTEEPSLSNDNPFIISSQNADTRTFIPSSSAASTIPKVIIQPPPNYPAMYLPDLASTDKEVNPGSISTIVASDNNLAV